MIVTSARSLLYHITSIFILALQVRTRTQIFPSLVRWLLSFFFLISDTHLVLAFTSSPREEPNLE